MKTSYLTRLFLAMVIGTVTASLAHAQSLKKLVVGEGDKAISPVFINMVVPDYLGYFKAEGLSVQTIPVGSQAAVLAGVNDGRLNIGAGTAGFALQRLASDGNLPGKLFFENAYPFRYGVIVKPDSPYKSLHDLVGKRIGVSSFGITVYPVVEGWFKLVGINPTKNLSWLAVGEGATAGYALQRGNIDALAYYDTGFGQIQAAGIPFRYLPIPKDAPRIGGAFFYASPAFLTEHRQEAIGFARAVLRGDIFIRTNPAAASYIFTRMFPEATPPGMSPENQVKLIMTSVTNVAPSFAPYDKSVKWGFIKESELRSEIDFYGLGAKITDPKVAYTNELIDAINDFDREKIKAAARDFKLPFKH